MIQRNCPSRQRRAAFTLMEMLIVVAIIVALAGIGGFFIMGQLEGAKKDAASAQVKVLTNACNAYKLKHNKFPETLNVLLNKDEFQMIYIDDPNALIDPWNQPYKYNPSGPNNQGMKPDIYTDGPGDGSGQIGNWPRKMAGQP